MTRWSFRSASKYPHGWFGSILGLYSGARVNEITQLRLDDIDTIGGVPGFFVRQGGKGQSLKNKNSRRFVSLAQPVVDCGFLDYVKEARQVGGAVVPGPAQLDRAGLWAAAEPSVFGLHQAARGLGEGQVFHGFRHTIASKLDEAGVSASAIATITGHRTGQTVLEKFYIDRRSLPDRVATLAKFSPPISIPSYNQVVGEWSFAT